MTKRHLVIATRESPLALKQADIVKEMLLKIHPHLSVELLGLTTQADENLDKKVIEIGGKGVFVKELEEALLDGRADIAVHSMKDVPMVLPSRLVLPVICEREEVRDALISNQYETLTQLPTSAGVGTSSLRRQTQLNVIRSDLDLRNIRGNINTRLKRLDDGDYDALILAAAGLKRMGFASRIRSYLSIEESLPAAGQGALGIECRQEDEHTIALISPLNDPNTQLCVQAERAVSRCLDGGCHVPIAAYAHIHHDVLTLRALVASPNGFTILRSARKGKPEDAEALGQRVAEELREQGAEKILKEYR